MAREETRSAGKLGEGIHEGGGGVEETQGKGRRVRGEGNLEGGEKSGKKRTHTRENQSSEALKSGTVG